MTSQQIENDLFCDFAPRQGSYMLPHSNLYLFISSSPQTFTEFSIGGRDKGRGVKCPPQPPNFSFPPIEVSLHTFLSILNHFSGDKKNFTALGFNMWHLKILLSRFTSTVCVTVSVFQIFKGLGLKGEGRRQLKSPTKTLHLT